MQSLPLELLVNCSGSRQENLPSSVGKSPDEFETILRAATGTAVGTSGPRGAAGGCGAQARSGQEVDKEHNALMGIFLKLNQAFQESPSGAGLEELAQIMAGSLSGEELALLADFLQGAAAADPGVAGQCGEMTSDRGESSQGESALLQKIMSALLQKTDNPGRCPAVEPGGAQAVLKSFLQGLLSADSNLQGEGPAGGPGEAFGKSHSDEISALAGLIRTALKDMAPQIQQTELKNDAPSEKQGGSSAGIMMLLAAVRERLAAAGGESPQPAGTADPGVENLFTPAGSQDKNGLLPADAVLVQQLIGQAGVQAGEDGGALHKALEQLLKQTAGHEPADQAGTHKKLDQLAAALQGNAESKNSPLHESLDQEKSAVKAFQAEAQKQTALLLNRLQQGGLVHDGSEKQRSARNNSRYPVLGRIQLREILSAGTEKSEKSGTRNLATQTAQALSLGEKAESAGKAAFKAPVNTQYVIDQMTERMGTAVRHGQNRIAVQLFPPSLGRLNITMTVKQNQLSAVILAESHQVKHVLEAHIDQLRLALEGQNIEVDKLSVFVGQEGDRNFASLLRDRSGSSKKSPVSDDCRAAAENAIGEIQPDGLPAHVMAFSGTGGIDLFA